MGICCLWFGIHSVSTHSSELFFNGNVAFSHSDRFRLSHQKTTGENTAHNMFHLTTTDAPHLPPNICNEKGERSSSSFRLLPLCGPVLTCRVRPEALEPQGCS